MDPQWRIYACLFALALDYEKEYLSCSKVEHIRWVDQNLIPLSIILQRISISLYARDSDQIDFCNR